MTSSALPSAAAADGNSPGSETAESINPSKDDDNDVAKIKTLIQTLISITPTSFEDEQSRYPTVPSAREARRRQWRICREVLHLLTKQHSDSRWVSHWSPDESEPRREKHGDSAENSFIRTSLKDYNKKRNIAQTPFSNESDEFYTPQQESTDNGCDNTESGGNNKTNANSYNGNANQTIREALGDLPSATTSQLATVLTKLLTQRIETSEILPDTQDSVANWEALGFLSDPGAVDTAENPNANASATNNAKQMQSATKTAMTLTPLSLTASRLYADLLGRHGAWGAGLVDIGGLSSISALVRRWCVECRGREPGGRAASRGSRNTTSGKSTDDGVSGHVAKRARSKIINNNSKKDRDGKQPTRRSARINSSVSFMDCDHDDDYDDDCEEENAADNISTVENSSTDPTLGTSQYNFQLDEDESDEDNGNSRYKDKFTNESQMILSGVRLAKSLSMPPLQPDYCNWSSEAKESYVEAASVALATSSALLVKAKNCVLTASTKNHDGVVNAGNGRRSRARMVDVSNEYEKEIIKKVVEECEFAVASLERALCATIRIQSGQGKKSASTTPTLSSSVVVRSSERIAAKKAQSPQEEDLEIKKKTKESGIFLLRGILPMLTMKMELPNGQVGKQAAYLTVSNLVVKIIQTVVAEKEKIAALKSRLLRISSRSAVKVDKGNNSSMTPRADHNNHHSQTPKRGGRKSISFSFTPGKATTKQNQAHSPLPTLLQPPSLKKSITPKRTRFSPSTISPANKQLQYDLLQQQQHPILTLLIGMLHKLFTSKGLERAESRSRVCSLGILCLEHFPSRERGQLLCFVSNMCQSRVSSHRLLGVELIGEVLCQDWFWKDEGNYQLKKTSEGAAEVSSLNLNSSLVHLALGNGVENDNIATTSILLFSSLHSRLTDKLPAVRTRTAMSFVGVLQKSNVNSVMGLNIQTSSEFNQDKESDDAFIGKSLTTTLCKIGPSLVHSLRNRARNDDKATVRRACIVAWLEMLSLAHREDQGFGISGLDISALCTLCNDPSVATRKAAAEALTKLVIDTYDSDEYSSQASALESAWAHTVLPLVSDAEVSCVSKAMEFFSKLIVDPIVDLAQDAAAKLSSGGNSRYYVAWRILSKLSDGGNEAGASRSGIGSLQTAIQKLFINAGDDCKTLTKNLLRAVYKIGILSLGIDNHASQHDLSTPNKGEFGEDFFERDMAAMRTGAWYILEALTNCLVDSNEARTAANISLKQAVRSSAIDCSYVVLSLKKLKELGNSVDISPSNKATLAATSRNCLKVISKIGGLVPLEDAKKCSSDLMQDLKSFSLPNDLMPSTISALVAFTKRICNDSGKDIIDECDEWINSLLDRCEYAIESWLSRFSRHGCIEIDDERLLTRILFCIGELTMVGFSSQQDTSQLRTKSSRDLVTDKDPVRGLFVRPSNRLVHLVKLMLPTTMPIPSVNEEDVTPTPSCVRAYAFVTLGKLCLRDESLAKDCLNILARELHHGSNSDPAVQSNALMVMGDLCVRYTNLVDRYLPFMAACLQAGNKACRKVVTDVNLSVDPSAIKVRNYSLVKKNAILLLSSLVLQDYIKWRGLFIHRFLAAVADEDDEVSCLARTALRGPLLEKQPNLLSNNFVEAIFVFNSCKAHPIYCAAAASGENGTGVAVDFDGTMLCGKEGYHKRFEVYRMMLTNMNDQQKLEVTVRLAKVVLGGALETNGDLSAVCKVPPQAIHPNEEDYYAKKVGTKRLESAMHVLTDTFAILKCSQIKVGHKSSVDPDQDEDALEQTGVKVDQRNLYKTSLLTKISCKHLMETIIPILCNLKTVLESSRSPFLKDLMHYLGYIFRSFKAEVKEHLAGDPTLLQELEYDFRKYRQRETSSGQDMKNSEDNVRISE